MDAALVLSSPPSRSPEQQLALEEAWRDISSEEGSGGMPGGIGGAVTTAIRDADPRTLQVAGATVAAILATGVAACWALGFFEEAHKPNEDDHRAVPSIWASSNSGSGGSGGGGKGGTAKTARGGGSHGSGPNEPYEGGASKAPGRFRRMSDEDMPGIDTRCTTPSRRASSSSGRSGGNGGRENTKPRRNEGGEYCSDGDESGGSTNSVSGDTTEDGAHAPAAIQTPVNVTPTSAHSGPGPATRSRTRHSRAKTGTASV